MHVFKSAVILTMCQEEKGDSAKGDYLKNKIKKE